MKLNDLIRTPKERNAKKTVQWYIISCPRAGYEGFFTIISINKCETKRTLTLKVVDEDIYTFVTFLCTYILLKGPQTHGQK